MYVRSSTSPCGPDLFLPSWVCHAICKKLCHSLSLVCWLGRNSCVFPVELLALECTYVYLMSPNLFRAVFQGIILPRNSPFVDVTASGWLERQYTVIACGLQFWSTLDPMVLSLNSTCILCTVPEYRHVHSPNIYPCRTVGHRPARFNAWRSDN